MFESRLASSLAEVANAEEPLRFPENQFAWAALSRVTQERTLTTIVGPSGSGKSLLVRAALKAHSHQRPGFRPLIAPLATWNKEHARAAAQGQVEAWIEGTLAADVIVFEDFDHTGPQSGTAPGPTGQRPAAAAQRGSGDWIAGWWDRLLQAGVSVIVTARQFPGELHAWPARVINRLHGGLLATLSPLSAETRRAILAAKFTQHQLQLTPRALDWLADQVRGTPHEVLSLAERVQRMFVTAGGRTIDTAELSEQWFVRVARTAPPKPSLEFIAELVAREFAIPLEQLCSRGRTPRLAIPRQCAMWLSRELAGQSLSRIGAFYGQRTHTTVSHGCARLQELLPQAPTLRQQVERLRRQALRPREHVG